MSGTFSGRPAVPMEEHHEAYFLWKSLGIQDAWCWHFDAHLDIGREGLDSSRLAALKGCQSSLEAEGKQLLGSCYLPWGGLHCGNYLYPAIKEGIVGRLNWVLPPYLPIGDRLRWVRDHLDGWFELSLTDYASFREENGRIVGHALGIPIEVGTWESFEPPNTPVLIDVDIDYFLTEDGEVWWEPDELAESLKRWDSLCTTVAYSVKGGYTPTLERRLAAPFLPDSVDTDGYQAGPLDIATTLYRCHRYEEAIMALKELHKSFPIESAYYIGSSYQKLKAPALALEALVPLCESSAIPTDGRAYLRGLCGELSLACENPLQALEHAAAGKKLSANDYRHHWTEAAAREALGEPKLAIKFARRALRLADNNLFSLRIRLALARLYRRQGQRELSRMELAQLALHDVTGEYRAATVL